VSIWLHTRTAEYDYPTLGFTAGPGDLLDASAAPDGFWTLNGDQGAAETVTRYTIGGNPGYVEPGDGHVLAWSDVDNAYKPTAPGTFLGTTAADTAVTALVNDTTPSLTRAALLATLARLTAWAKSPDTLITGAITVDVDDLVTSAAVLWPDGATGVLTITARHATDAVTAYNVTYDDGTTTLTFTQPAITRNTTGAATNVPAMVVA